MFEFKQGISMNDAVEKRIASKNTDSQEQPEAKDVVNVSEDAPVEDVVEPEAQANEEVAAEAEESESEEAGQATETDTDEDLYVEYKGREINLRDVEEWEQGSLRQADYTRKTQQHAEEVKNFTAKQEEFNVKQIEFNQKLQQLEAMIEEDTPSAETLAEWREYEPEKLLDYQEKQSKRKALLDSKQPTASSVDVAAEQAKLWQANPQWSDNGKQTKAFEDDIARTQEYALKNGYSNGELASITSAHHLQTLINAAKFESMGKSNAAIEKKVRKAPVSTKPKAAAQSRTVTDVKAAKAKFMKTGNNEDYVAYKKLARAARN